MQDGHDPDQASHIMRVGGQLEDRMSRRLHEEGIDLPLVEARKAPELWGSVKITW
jgi:hypothetical protein